MNDIHNTLLKGIVGVTAPLIGIATSIQDIENYLRVGSLVVGILVGLVTIWSIIRKS